MFLSPSVCNLEFKKYSECAAAKCVPVGIPPNSFNKDMLEPFLMIDFNNISKSIKRIYSIHNNELIERSELYYRSTIKHRNPDILNKKLEYYIDLALNQL
ncbi:MAG: hypothetical protein ACRENO_04500 [Thermodesulfobacteriota bacterium]